MNSLSCTLLAGLLVAASTVHSAETTDNKRGYEINGSVLGDDVLYSIGGGSAVSMSGAPDMRSLGVGVGWNSNLICGNMDLSTTLQNQLNGVTNGFQTIMSSVIQNASRAVASLPAMIIQRADPALYNLLSNGILQARLDFDRSKANCQAMANRMADMAGAQLGWDQLAQGQALGQSTSPQNTDAVAAIEQSERERGNQGVPWVGGQQAGGRGQAPIKLISDVSKAGYNLLNGRQVGDRSRVDQERCGNRLSCQTWDSPQTAADFATRVLGEREQRTCDNCTKTQTTPGVGLTPQIQEAYEKKLQALQALVNGRTEPTADQLAEAGSQSLPITRGVIEALRDETDSRLLTQRLASEVALASVLEKALLLQRTLLAGRKEPNVAINELAQQAISSDSDTLAQEINSLKTELELRQTLAGNSAMTLIQRHSTRSSGSRGVYEGDPTRNRVDEIEKVPPTDTQP
ncbi:integrating conjugative element protein [Pseudomonas fluorescens]|uniref:integrating conjugative element protein n=1 Tax=Pseudomonas fluorescens TaxID=294 RepID=UPI001BE852F3|nr:integrating conjugative element protein [Pseudomonas fluorescens]MBT2375349.1 integrating conjugative element protein [Pseudomonas fluorescens]